MVCVSIYFWCIALGLDSCRIPWIDPEATPMILQRNLCLRLIYWLGFSLAGLAILIICISWLDNSGSLSLSTVFADWNGLLLNGGVALYGLAVSLFVWRMDQTGLWSAMQFSGWSNRSLAISVCVSSRRRQSSAN